MRAIYASALQSVSRYPRANNYPEYLIEATHKEEMGLNIFYRINLITSTILSYSRSRMYESA